MQSIKKGLIASSVLVVLPAMAFAQMPKNAERVVNRLNERREGIHENLPIVKTRSYIGKVASISGNSIVINANKTAYTVDATNAKFIKRFGGALNLADIQTNDRLNVVGTLSGTNITATQIRDLSLQNYRGTFVGTVDSVGSNNFVLKSVKRGNQTINTTSTTVYRLNGKVGQFSDISVGAKATVTGTWDRSNQNVTATRIAIRK